jgi:hypothetical protein
VKAFHIETGLRVVEKQEHMPGIAIDQAREVIQALAKTRSRQRFRTSFFETDIGNRLSSAMTRRSRASAMRQFTRVVLGAVEDEWITRASRVARGPAPSCSITAHR